eukprot:4369402-Pyramimonas_sp.AAC.2
MLKRKFWRSKIVMADYELQRVRALVSWVAEPIDSLWMRIQKLDEGGAPLYDLQRSCNPFAVCVDELMGYMCEPLPLSPLRFLFDHFCGDVDSHAAMMKDAHDTVLCMIAQMHWRFLRLYRAWPYRLVNLVDERVSPEE